MSRTCRTALVLLLGLAACDGGTDAATDDETDAEEVPNRRPPSPEVRIEPAEPVQGTPLEVAWEPVVDPDGDELTFNVRWTVDDPEVEVPKRVRQIPGELVVRGQTWTARVMANDGELRSKPAHATVTIGNAAPEIDTFAWSPEAPRVGDTISASATAWDLEGDRIRFTYAFTLNGVEVARGNQRLLPPGEHAKGDTLTITVVADDGEGGVTEVTSDPIVVANTPPTAPVVRVTPRVAGRDDALTCELIAPGVDADGDPITHVLTWTRNGQPVAGATATVQVGETLVQPGGVARDGETWACLGQAEDDVERGPAGFQAITIGAAPPDVQDLALGPQFTCGMRADGATACWGVDGDAVNLVKTGRTQRPADVPMDGLAAGTDFACGIQADDGRVTCWGSGSPTGIPAIGFQRIDASGAWACGLTDDGDLRCFGAGAAQRTPPAGEFRALAVGDAHGCAVATDGTLACWGDNLGGKATPPEGNGFLRVAAGANHTCAVNATRELSCWGADAAGQSTVPAGEYTNVAAGGDTTCAIRVDGGIDCWGAGAAFEPPPGAFLRLWVGPTHACALDVDNGVACWGDPSGGATLLPWGRAALVEAGNDDVCMLDFNGLPTCFGADVAGETRAPFGPFVDLSVGGDHACGLTVDDEVRCWGDDRLGQAGSPAGAWTDVAAGADFTCGVDARGQLACWGNPGTTGLGAYDLRSVPTGQFTQVSAGSTHACALATDGSAPCWGSAGGRAGPFVQLATGDASTCGLASDGALTCWGFAFGGPPRGAVFTQISVGGVYGCGLLEDTSVRCWPGPMLGIADVRPAPPPRGTGWKHVTAGMNAWCAIDADDRVWCDGYFARQPLDAGL